MKIKSLLLLAVFAVIGFIGCGGPGDDGPPNDPPCYWNNQGRVSYRSVLLKAPSTNIPMYKYIYTGVNNEISQLREVFGPSWEQANSSVKVTTIASGCTGTVSTTNLFTAPNYQGKVGINDINGLSKPTNAWGLPRITVEIKSGPHRDDYGNTGYVVWSKVAPNAYEMQADGIFYGVFQCFNVMGIVNPSDFRNKIYINGTMSKF